MLLVHSHTFACEEVVDVGPVSDDHTVPVETFLEPACEKFLVSVHRDAVNTGAVHHNCKGTCLNASLERSEVLLFEFILRDIGRSSVLTCTWVAIAEIMLHRHCDIVRTDMVRILTLHTANGRSALNSVHERILTVVLPNAWPTWVAREVYCRRVSPRAVCRTAFVCSDDTGVICDLRVE